MGQIRRSTRKDAAILASVAEVKGDGFDTDKDSLWEIGDTINHDTNIFPSTTARTATLTSGAQNVWGAWTRMVDSLGTFFDAGLSTHSHITMVGIESEQAAGIYMMEISYGAARTVVARIRWNSTIAGIFAAVQQYRVRSLQIPANSRVYGRVMCNVVAGTQTVTYQIRSYMH